MCAPKPSSLMRKFAKITDESAERRRLFRAQTSTATVDRAHTGPAAVRNRAGGELPAQRAAGRPRPMDSHIAAAKMKLIKGALRVNGQSLRASRRGRSLFGPTHTTIMLVRTLAVACAAVLCLGGGTDAAAATAPPALPGRIPVFIRPGDTPLEDISPQLAEAFDVQAQRRARVALVRAWAPRAPPPAPGGSRIFVAIRTLNDGPAGLRRALELADDAGDTSKITHIQKIPAPPQP